MFVAAIDQVEADHGGGGQDRRAAAAAVAQAMDQRLNPQQSFRSTLGNIRLAKQPGAERLQVTCSRGDTESILRNSPERGQILIIRSNRPINPVSLRSEGWPV